jgi:hypothetical protein
MSDSRNSTRNNIEEDNAKFDLINRIVERAGSRANPAERNSFYNQQLPKVPKFSLEDCIEQVLNGTASSNKGEPQPEPAALRSFETVDFDALTRGFEPEEVKDGKLVLYITENQLLQLLKQRAIIVPNKKTLSSHDFSRNTLSLVDENVGDRLGSKSSVKEVELVVEDARSSRAGSRAATNASQRPQSSRATQQSSGSANNGCDEDGNPLPGSALGGSNRYVLNINVRLISHGIKI